MRGVAAERLFLLRRASRFDVADGRAQGVRTWSSPAYAPLVPGSIRHRAGGTRATLNKGGVAGLKQPARVSVATVSSKRRNQ